MSRSDYSDDIDNWDLIRWRGQVASSIRGKRGQQLLKELAEALDAMPVKRLIANELKSEKGYCALGVVGEKRGINLDEIEPCDRETISKEFNISEQLAQEIAYQNDEMSASWNSPEERWKYMRGWVEDNLIKSKGETK